MQRVITLEEMDEAREARERNRPSQHGPTNRDPRYHAGRNAPSRVRSRSVVAPRHIPVKLRRPRPPRIGR
jgi:hypothetical protein